MDFLQRRIGQFYIYAGKQGLHNNHALLRSVRQLQFNSIPSFCKGTGHCLFLCIDFTGGSADHFAEIIQNHIRNILNGSDEQIPYLVPV